MSSLDVRAIDKADLKKKARPAVAQELTVYIAEAAFDRAVERGGKDTSREIGGVLVGEVLVDERGPYLSIEATIDALHADEKGAELTFTHATWDHIHKEMDTKFAGKKVVGWYHTHPGFGVFLSDRDQFIHKSFFNRRSRWRWSTTPRPASTACSPGATTRPGACAATSSATASTPGTATAPRRGPRRTTTRPRPATAATTAAIAIATVIAIVIATPTTTSASAR
jgi:proteasome lid subunit RPN8/RPN11